MNATEKKEFLGRKKLKSKKKIRKFAEVKGKGNKQIITHSDNKIDNNVDDIKEMKHKNLNYEIDNWSSYISTFHPRNILLDTKISGQVSKWSVDFKSQNEYLYLKLEKTSIVYILTFGKFKDPTNLKEFKIYAGLNKSDMIEILHSGLSLEEGYEPFVVNYKWEGTPIPCKYLKIVPIRPWDDNYNISIWFINIKGIDDPILIEKTVQEFSKKKELDSMKNWLSLSRLNLKNKCLDLLKVKGFDQMIKSVESPLITELYKCLMKGDFERCSEIISVFSQQGYYDNYLDSLPYKIKWKQIDFLDKEIDNFMNYFNTSVKLEEEKSKKINKDSSDDNQENAQNNNLQNLDLENEEDYEEGLLDFDIQSQISGYSLFPEGMESPTSEIIMNNPEERIRSMYPSGRGGHSMVLDDDNLIIYMFGGWDGTEDLNDFWLYDIKKESWKLISSNTQSEMGPSKRSCHKMVYDSNKSRILLYGMYGKPSELPFENILYEFCTKSFKWKKYNITKELKEGTLIKSNGPGQVFDHQLVIDSAQQVLYIFGGSKIAETEDSFNGKYLGLWKLNLTDCYWENLQCEQSKDPYNIKLKSRCGHSMVLGPENELIIYGGNKGPRKVNSLFDMILFNTKTHTLRELFHDYSKKNGPYTNFSSCSYFDQNKNELYVFGGCFINEKMDSLTNNLWVLNFMTEKWTKTYVNNKNSINYDKMKVSNNFYRDFLDLNFNINPNNINFTDQGSSNISYDKSISYSNNDTLNEPLPRYAHCMVFSKHLNKGFVFGGNPNLKNTSKKTERLNDLWTFELYKKTSDKIGRKLKSKVYTLYYKEMCLEGNIDKAMEILKNKIMPLIRNKQKKVGKLTNMLLGININLNREDFYIKRYEIYEKIFKYISSSANIKSGFLNR